MLQRAGAHLARQRLIGRKAADSVLSLWARVDRQAIVASWRYAVPAAAQLLTTAQGVAAASAGPYVDDILEDHRLPAGAAGRIVPEAFTGHAADGRPLQSLLEQPAYRALTALARGRTLDEAMAAGALSLDLIVRTQVADAGRVADGVALTARPQLAGYARMLTTPPCAPCLLLAARFYRWNAGFLRHPRCDCRHIPTTEITGRYLRTDPVVYFASLDAAEQDRIFTVAGAQAIRDGTDMAQIVSTRRGLSTAANGRSFTTAATGVTSRGTRRVQLLPEAIYLAADGDRDEALRLLALHGYLTI